MKKTPDKLLKIGDTVIVKGYIDIYYEDRRRKINRINIDPPIHAIICGATRRRLGLVHPGVHYGGLDGDDYDQGYLSIEQTVFVYQVRRGLMRKQFECFPDDVYKVRPNRKKKI